MAHNEQLLFYPQCFLLKQIIVSQFVHIFAILLSRTFVKTFDF